MAAARPRPRPLELIARLLIAAALVFSLSQVFERALVTSLAPVLSHVIEALDGDFTILAADVNRGPGETLRFRANLTHPLEMRGRIFYPFGWGSKPAGRFQVTVTAGSVLQYCALMLILVVAWPAARPREYGLRAAIGAPLFAVLLLMPVPITVLAELWNLIRAELDPGKLQPLMICSRFLMGGGGLALGLLFGGVTIAVAAGGHENHGGFTAQECR